MKIKIQNFYLYKDGMGFHGVTKESNMTEWLNSSNSSSVIVFGKMLHICALNVFIYWFQLSVTLRHTKLIQAERTLLNKIYF